MVSWNTRGSRVTPRRGFNSANGAMPMGISFNEVSIVVQKLNDGTLHLVQFTPRLSGL